MDDIETLVPSFATCERLKENGLRQDFALGWAAWDDPEAPKWTVEFSLVKDLVEEWEWIAAPSLQELLGEHPEMLEIEVNGGFRTSGRLTVHFHEGKFAVFYDGILVQEMFSRFVHENAAEAAAELWLWCKEKGYL